MDKREVTRFLPPFLVLLITFGVYVYCLCPTVYWDDAGELIAACYTLGIPHPPGHPLYAIVGWLFTLIPIGSPAYRVNLMSAFFGALTCALLFQIVFELIEKEGDSEPSLAGSTNVGMGRIFGPHNVAVFAGITAALSSGFSLILWDQSVVAETTTLHTFFMMLVTLLAFRIEAGGPDHSRLTQRLLFFSFLYGLSFTNHVAGLFFAPPLAFILLAGVRLRIFRPARLAGMLLLFALGLSVYAYLPLRSRYNPSIDWGNPETLKNFLWVVTARQYSSNILRVPTLIAFKTGMSAVAATFLSNLTVLGCIFALIGALRLWKTRKPVLIYGITVILILFFISLNSAFIFAYLAPAVLILAMWAGVGMALLCRMTERASASLSGFSRRAPMRAVHCAAVLLPVILFLTHFHANNKRHYTFAKDYGEALLSSLPENSILITGSADPLFISWYLQYCENYRTDLKVITRNGLVRPGYLDQIRRQHPDLNIPKEFTYEKAAESARPAYMEERGEGLPWYANSYFKLFYDLNHVQFPIYWEGVEANQVLMNKFVPFYFVFQILPQGRQDAHSPRFLDVAEIRTRIRGDLAAGKVYENHIFSYAVYSQWHGDIPAAMRYFEDALDLWPTDSRALNNIGALLAQQGKTTEAFEKFVEAYRANPGDPTSNHNVGQALLDRGEVRKAIPHFRAAIALDPDNFEDYYDLGLCHTGLGKNRLAVDMFKKALQIKPDSPEAMSSLGVAYLRLGETENAARLLRTVVKLEPGNAENWYNLACLQALEGDEVGTSESLAKALTLDFKKTYALASKDSRLSSVLQSLVKKQ